MVVQRVQYLPGAVSVLGDWWVGWAVRGGSITHSILLTDTASLPAAAKQQSAKQQTVSTSHCACVLLAKFLLL
jgi:hypothetical protein